MKTGLLLSIGASVSVLVSVVQGQTNVPMTDMGSAAPPRGPYDITQTLCAYCASAHGTHDGPDGLNYYTDNGPNHGLWAGQTFTTGTNSAGYNLASVSIKTAGVDDGGGYANGQIFHLYLYSVSGSTATLLAHFTNYSSHVDGDWVQWNPGTNSVTLAASSTYAYGFGRDASGSGYAGLGNTSGNPYPGGELAMLPTSGGTVTFGSSHNYDATFEIGLNAVGAPTVALSASPSYAQTGQVFTITATVTPGLGTVTNVTVNLSAIGGASAAGLVLSSGNIYTNTFSVPAGAPPGTAILTATATDTTPLAGAGQAAFTVISAKTATVDFTKTAQTIEGLGGATAFWVGNLSGNTYKMEIYTNAFAGLNLSMLRLGNWYRYQSSVIGFDSAAFDVVANANRVLGHPVPVYMSSWAPPAFLKSNGQTGNGGTLLYTNGSFVYTNFAQYWYDSINAYKSNGVNLTWISIQNEPDWVAGYDSCIFHPTEDTVNGTNYASYSKALDATYKQLTNLPSPPKILAPECVHFSFGDLQSYASTMNANSFYGVAHHLYGDATDPATLSLVTNIFPSKPRFMTEFGLPDMIDQATLLHNELVFEQVSGYNYWSLVYPAGGGLIVLENSTDPKTWTNAPPGIPEPHGYWIAPAYWAMKHFSYFINPGFKRASASDTDNNVLSSAYISPDNLRLVVILINTSASSPSVMSVNYGAFAAGKSSVYQTVGTNTWQSLGALADPVLLPSRSLTTIVLDKIVTVGAASNAAPTNGAPAISLSSALSWTSGSNAVTHAVYMGTSSNAVANATPASPEFQGVAWTNNFALSAASWGTAYYWRVDEIAYANTNHGVVWSFNTAPAVQLPSPWQSQDIGSTAGQSSAIYNNGVFTVTGSGADIWNTADAFRFVYIPATGNCTIVARVTSVQNTDPWAKAGVMIRSNLTANAANAFIAVTPGNGVTWQTRSSSGGITGNTPAAGLNAPYWVKLVRNGNTFTGYRSPDGVAWTQQGTATFSMAATAYIGLAVTSHNNSSLCTAVFDNVTAPNWPLLPDAPGSLTAMAGDAQVTLSWAAASGASSYNLKSATNNGGPYTVLTNVTTTVYTNTGLLNGTTYFYVVSALNIAGESTDSAPASATPQVLVILTISQSGTNLVFSWPLVSGFSLQSTTNLASGNWVNLTSPAPQMVGSRWQVSLPVSASNLSTFYRLLK